MCDDLTQKIKMTQKRSQELKKQKFDELWSIVEECSSILNEIHPNKRRTWLESVINQLHEQQNGKCPLCGQQLELEAYHVDHKIPFSKGGGNERNNLQLTHPQCNQSKSNTVDVIELLDYLQDLYMNLPDQKKILFLKKKDE